MLYINMNKTVMHVSPLSLPPPLPRFQPMRQRNTLTHASFPSSSSPSPASFLAELLGDDLGDAGSWVHSPEVCDPLVALLLLLLPFNSPSGDFFTSCLPLVYPFLFLVLAVVRSPRRRVGSRGRDGCFLPPVQAWKWSRHGYGTFLGD